MSFDLAALTKMEIRKLNALRKSIGEDLANSTFAKWLKQKPAKTSGGVADKSAQKIEEVLWGLVKDKTIRIPKTGYVLKRGRGRVLVTSVTISEKPAKAVSKKKKA